MGMAKALERVTRSETESILMFFFVVVFLPAGPSQYRLLPSPGGDVQVKFSSPRLRLNLLAVQPIYVSC